MTDSPTGADRAAQPVTTDAAAPLRRPRGRDRYPEGVVPDEPSQLERRADRNRPPGSHRAPDDVRRLVLAMDETAAVRPPAQLPPVTHTPATQQPATQPPATQTPTQPPATQQATTQTPAVDAPAAEEARVESSATTPASETPVASPPKRAHGRRVIAAGRYEGPLGQRRPREFAAHEASGAATRPETQATDALDEAVPPALDTDGELGTETAVIGEVPASPVAARQAAADIATRAIAVNRPSASFPRRRSRPSRSGTLVMGILNVTPDSFSDGGRYVDVDDALDHARQMVAAGADIIDVGGESTRPDATRVDPREEQRRVLPIVRQLVSEGTRVSIDTMNAATAYAAVEKGADIINDVSGGLADRFMAQVAADTGRTFVAMHWRGHLDGSSDTHYDDAPTQVRDELRQRVAELVVQGVDPERLVLDPGLGFSKDAVQNWQVLASLPELTRLGLPLLVGASRKRFLGELLPPEARPEARDPATAVVSVLAAQAGAWAVRVHDVASTRAALDVWRAWEDGAATATKARHA
ncbi:dihydropteroate synthase [Frigoribacterium sp. 2-23]|uniref:dihydropteroate synthase n=1 Tax=Frigoribacterium sp. 2-23 TaxID=3415006 RepID=UPI003C701C04